MTSRELRDDTAEVLRRAAVGEIVEVTVNGEPVAELGPIHEQRSHWTPKEVFTARLATGSGGPGTRGGSARPDDRHR